MGAALLLSDYVAAERERIMRTLFDWLRIPSISAHADRAGDVTASAAFTADLLAQARLEHVEVLETAGAGSTRPSSSSASGCPATASTRPTSGS